MKIKILLLAALTLSATYVRAQSPTVFTFEGRLNTNGTAVTGAYDLQFTLFDAVSNGNVIAGPVTNVATAVTNGYFQSKLDFGSSPFNGAARWLEIGVRTNGGTGAFTELSPLQQITATPYAISALSLSGVLAQTNLPAGVLANNQTNVTLGGTFNGSGFGLTNIQLSSVVGFLKPTQLPPGLLTNGEVGLSLSGTFTGRLVGDGTSVSNLNATNLTGFIQTAALPAIVVTNNETGVTLSGTFKGNASGLTNLPLPTGLITNSQGGLTLNGAFSGNGAGLTNLPLPVGIVTNNEAGVSLAGSFTGNGGGLSNLSASSLTGTISVGTLPPGLVAAVVTNNQAGVSLTGTFSGNGAGLTNLPISIPAGVVTNNETNVTLSGAFNGNGAGLTNVSLSTASGFLPTSKLSGSIPAVQISGVLSSGQLPTTFITNGTTNVVIGGLISGSFLGNGSGLTNLSAANLIGPVPSNSLAVVPAGKIAGTISSANLPTSLVTNGQSGVTLSGTFTGNGSGLTGLVPAGVITNNQTGVNLAGFFSGNGSGLNSLQAGTLTGFVPSGALNSVPAGNLTGTVPSGALSGTYTNALNLSNPGNVINGTVNATIVTTALNATSITNSGGLTNSGNAFVSNTIPVSLWVTNGSTLKGVQIDNAGNVQASGNISAAGNSAVTGNSTVTGNLTVNGTITGSLSSGSVSVPTVTAATSITDNGSLSVTGGATLSGNTTVGGTLGVAGTLTGAAINATTVTASSGITDNGALTSVKALTSVGGVTGATVTGTTSVSSPQVNAGAIVNTGALNNTGIVTISSNSVATDVAILSVTNLTQHLGAQIDNFGDLAISGNLTVNGAFQGTFNPSSIVDSGPLQASGITDIGANTTVQTLNSVNLTNTGTLIVTNTTDHNFVSISDGNLVVSGGTITGNLNGTVSGFSGNLAGDVTGTQSATVVSTVGGQSAANVASAATGVAAATSANTANTIVKRDGSGNFAASTITANVTGNVTGNVSGSAGSFTGNLVGDVTGTQGATTVASVGGQSAANVGNATFAVQQATSAATPFALARRDIFGGLSASTFTGNLTGNVTGNVSGSAGSFTGNLAGDVTGTQGATVVGHVGGATAASVATAVTEVGAATAADTANTLVLRDANGDFSVGGIDSLNLTNDGTLIVTNSTDHNAVVLNDGNITATGTISGNGGGLSNLFSAAGNPVIDTTAFATNFAFDTSLTTQADTQSAGSAPTPILVEVNGTNNGWTVATGSGVTTFTPTQGGVYRVDYQAVPLSGSSSAIVIGAVTNGVVIPGSAVQVQSPGGNTPLPVSRSFMFTYANQPLSFAFSSTGGVGFIAPQTFTVGSTTFTTPAFSVTITRVSP